MKFIQSNQYVAITVDTDALVLEISNRSAEHAPMFPAVFVSD